MRIVLPLLSILVLSHPLWGQEEDFDLQPTEEDQLEAIMRDSGEEFLDDDELQESERAQETSPLEDDQETVIDTAAPEPGPIPAPPPAPEKKVVNSERAGKSLTIGEFNVGKEEEALLNFAKNIGNKISPTEWNEIVQTISANTYTIVENDTLWSISKTLFGTGFYYSKLWSLNPYITNPHQIEPGMVLSFSLGSETSSPEVKFGKFSLDSEGSDEDADGEKLEGLRVEENGEYDWGMFSRFAESGPSSLARGEKKAHPARSARGNGFGLYL